MKNTLHAFIIGNKESHKSLTLILNKEFQESEIDFRTENFQSGSSYFNKNPTDLIIAEIPADTEGFFQILSKLQQQYSSVIFMTDSSNPVCPALEKEVVPTPGKTFAHFSTDNLLLPQNKISLPTLQGFRRVNVNEIIRCEADSNYTFIYLLDQTKVMVSKTLHDFEKNLSPYNFFRIHHKHLINLDHLKEYIKGKGGQVIMADNSVLDVSIRRKNGFLHKMI